MRKTWAVTNITHNPGFMMSHEYVAVAPGETMYITEHCLPERVYEWIQKNQAIVVLLDGGMDGDVGPLTSIILISPDRSKRKRIWLRDDDFVTESPV